MLDTLQQSLVARLAPVLERQLARDGAVRVIVEGWADSHNSEDSVANKALAQQRALAVKEELILNGIPASRIETETNLEKSEITEAGRQASRGARIMLRAPRIITSTAVHAAAAARPVRADGAEAALAPAAAPQSQGAWSMSMASLATTATDVLLDRASEQVQVYVIGVASRRLCSLTDADRQARRDAPKNGGGNPAAGVSSGSDNHEMREYLPQTCAFFGRDRSWQQIGDVRSLRSAFADDVRAMPERFAFQGLERRLSTARADDAFVDAGQSAMFVLHVVDKIGRGQDPLSVFARLARDGTPQFTLGGLSYSYHHQLSPSMPLTASFQRFAHLAAKIDDARESLGEFALGAAVPADTTMAYALRALLVAHRDTVQTQSAHAQQLLGAKLENVGRLLAAHRSVESTVAELQR
ncbi:MAG TPA: OmpA family protein, partial [Longimicrobium sp.]